MVTGFATWIEPLQTVHGLRALIRSLLLYSNPLQVSYGRLTERGATKTFSYTPCETQAFTCSQLGESDRPISDGIHSSLLYDECG